MVLVFGLGGSELSLTLDNVLVVLAIGVFLLFVELGDEATHKVDNIVDDAFRGKVYL